MPIYEYACEACAHSFEQWQKMSEPAIAECPSCHEQKVRRLISAAAFQLKGTGWYATDYKKSSQEKAGG